MKTLKITLIITLFFAFLTSCTKQDVAEDDALQSPNVEYRNTGGNTGD